MSEFVTRLRDQGDVDVEVVDGPDVVDELVVPIVELEVMGTVVDVDVEDGDELRLVVVVHIDGAVVVEATALPEFAVKVMFSYTKDKLPEDTRFSRALA